MVIRGDRLHLQITYYRDRFSGAVVEDMLGHFRNLLVEMIRFPEKRLDQFEMLGEQERRRTLVDWNRTEPGKLDAVDLPARFEARASRTPDAVAAACGIDRISFRDLNARANRIAHALIARGTGPDALVSLIDERGIDLLVGILAGFKARGAYIPLDPAYPQARNKQLVEQSRPALVIAGASRLADRQEALNSDGESKPPIIGLAELEAERRSEQNPMTRGNLQNLAYVIYTSGSTGAPKGAMVERAGMLNNLLSKVS
ncbi:MAG: AMP-binding protein, partial [Methylococcales bacterium]